MAVISNGDVSDSDVCSCIGSFGDRRDCVGQSDGGWCHIQRIVVLDGDRRCARCTYIIATGVGDAKSERLRTFADRVVHRCDGEVHVSLTNGKGYRAGECWRVVSCGSLSGSSGDTVDRSKRGSGAACAADTEGP